MSDEPYVISQQGAIIVNSGEVVHASDNVVCILLDLRSKYPEFTGTGATWVGNSCVASVTLGANDRTLHIDEAAGAESFTEIEFPMFDGFLVFAAMCGKYSLKVCLAKEPQ